MARYARNTDARALNDVLAGADIFLGLSAPHVLKPEYLAQMAARPIIMALANPDPEITPEEARQARPDAIIATGRSDFPNQVNNVLCFPVHLPRRAGCRRHHHQRGNEAGGRHGYRGTRPAGGQRSRRSRLWRHRPHFRSLNTSFQNPSIRKTDPARRPCRRPRRHAIGRRPTPDRGLGNLSRAA